MTRASGVPVIEVKQTGAGDPMQFAVTVREGQSQTRHQVTMRQATHATLTGGQTSDPAGCIRAAFAFLLDREPKESILGSFDVTVIQRYFPEFERELATARTLSEHIAYSTITALEGPPRRIADLRYTIARVANVQAQLAGGGSKQAPDERRQELIDRLVDVFKGITISLLAEESALSPDERTATTAAISGHVDGWGSLFVKSRLEPALYWTFSQTTSDFRGWELRLSVKKRSGWTFALRRPPDQSRTKTDGKTASVELSPAVASTLAVLHDVWALGPFTDAYRSPFGRALRDVSWVTAEWKQLDVSWTVAWPRPRFASFWEADMFSAMLATDPAQFIPGVDENEDHRRDLLAFWWLAVGTGLVGRAPNLAGEKWWLRRDSDDLPAWGRLIENLENLTAPAATASERAARSEWLRRVALFICPEHGLTKHARHMFQGSKKLQAHWTGDVAELDKRRTEKLADCPEGLRDLFLRETPWGKPPRSAPVVNRAMP